MRVTQEYVVDVVAVGIADGSMSGSGRALFAGFFLRPVSLSYFQGMDPEGDRNNGGPGRLK